jgi:hypothetical protein
MLPPSNDDIADRIEDNGQLATEHPRRVEKDAANLRHDQIAARMWDDYQRVLHVNFSALPSFPMQCCDHNILYYTSKYNKTIDKGT